MSCSTSGAGLWRNFCWEVTAQEWTEAVPGQQIKSDFMTAASACVTTQFITTITGMTSFFGQAYQLTPPTQVLTHHMSCSGPKSVTPQNVRGALMRGGESALSSQCHSTKLCLVWLTELIMFSQMKILPKFQNKGNKKNWVSQCVKAH